MDKGRKLRAGDPSADGFLEVSSSPCPVFSTPLGWVASAVLWGLCGEHAQNNYTGEVQKPLLGNPPP